MASVFLSAKFFNGVRKNATVVAQVFNAFWRAVKQKRAYVIPISVCPSVRVSIRPSTNVEVFACSIIGVKMCHLCLFFIGGIHGTALHGIVL